MNEQSKTQKLTQKLKSLLATWIIIVLFVSLITLAFKTNVLELIIEQNFVGIHFNYLVEVR
jgi:cell division protein FtsL